MNPKEVEASKVSDSASNSKGPNDLTLGMQEEPHFEVLFTSSYGMNRDQLERINRDIQLGKIPGRRVGVLRGSSTVFYTLRNHSYKVD